MNTLKTVISLTIIMFALLTTGCSKYEKAASTPGQTEMHGIAPIIEELHSIDRERLVNKDEL